MKGFATLAVAAGLALSIPQGAAAQDRGMWTPLSSSAKKTTGDISLTDSKLYINLTPFLLGPIRKLKPAETTAAFAAEEVEGGSGALYKISVPARVRFLNHNSLCGSEDVEWMVTAVTGKTLYIAFFSGPNMPALTPEAMMNNTDLCGTFTYFR